MGEPELAMELARLKQIEDNKQKLRQLGLPCDDKPLPKKATLGHLCRMAGIVELSTELECCCDFYYVSDLVHV